MLIFVLFKSINRTSLMIFSSISLLLIFFGCIKNVTESNYSTIEGWPCYRSILLLNFSRDTNDPSLSDENHCLDLLLKEKNQMKNINLCNLNFQQLPIEFFKKIPSIEYLDISFNPKLEISDQNIKLLAKKGLKYLNATNACQLNAKSLLKFFTIPGMVELNISQPQHGWLINEIDLMPKLLKKNLIKKLVLTGLSINFPLFSEVLIKSPNLVSLSVTLHSTCISTYEQNVVFPVDEILPNLERLEISRYYDRVLHSRWLKEFLKCRNLRVLSIFSGDFSDSSILLSDLIFCEKLEKSKIEELSLTDARLRFGIFQILIKLKSLKKLNLGYNWEIIDESVLERGRRVNAVIGNMWSFTKKLILRVGYQEQAIRKYSFLSYLAGLEELSMPDCHLTSSFFAGICFYLKDLKKLNLASNPLIGSELQNFSLGLLSGPNVLEELDMKKCGLDSVFLANIWDNLKNLKKLNLGKNLSIGSNLSLFNFSILSELGSLEECYMPKCGLNASFAIGLISKCPKLKKLKLGNNFQLSANIYEFDGVPALNCLEELDLSESGLNCGFLLGILSKSPNLIKLNIFCNQSFTSGNFDVNSLSELTFLEELNMENCDLDFSSLLKILSKTPNLKTLYLDGNSDIFSEEFNSSALPELKFLEELGVSGCELSLGILIKLCERFPNLKRLNIGYNSKIGLMLKDCDSDVKLGLKYLEELNAVDCELDWEFVKGILTDCPYLKKLNVNNNPLIGQSIPANLDLSMFLNLKYLEEVLISWSGITNEMKQRIKKAFANKIRVHC